MHRTTTDRWVHPNENILILFNIPIILVMVEVIILTIPVEIKAINLNESET